MIDANQDKQCERNNKIVENLSKKIKIKKFGGVFTITINEMLNELLTASEEKKSNGNMQST